MQRLFSTTLVLVLIALTSCQRPDAANQPLSGTEAKGQPQWCATIYPIQFLGQQIAGDFADVKCLSSESSQPLQWQPDDDDIQMLQKSGIVLLNGSGLEPWLSSITIREEKLVNTGRSIGDQIIELDDPVHQHGPEGDRSASTTVPTTWLDPELAIRQAETVRDELIRRYPAEKDRFEQNFMGLLGKLMASRVRLDAVGVLRPEHAVVVSDPSLLYMVQAANGTAHLVPLDPSEMPSQQLMDELARIQNEYNAKVILWTRDVDDDVRQRIATLGMESVVIDPCIVPSSDGDFATVMQANVESYAAAVSK